VLGLLARETEEDKMKISGHSKTTIGIVMMAFALVSLPDTYSGHELAYTVKALIAFLALYPIIKGVEDSSRSGNAAKDLKDGYYVILSIPTVETSFKANSDEIGEIGFTPMNEFDIKKTQGPVTAVHLLAKHEQEKEAKYYVIPAHKIKERVWPLLQIHHQLEIRGGIAQYVFKPSEAE